MLTLPLPIVDASTACDDRQFTTRLFADQRLVPRLDRGVLVVAAGFFFLGFE